MKRSQRTINDAFAKQVVADAAAKLKAIYGCEILVKIEVDNSKSTGLPTSEQVIDIVCQQLMVDKEMVRSTGQHFTQCRRIADARKMISKIMMTDYSWLTLSQVAFMIGVKEHSTVFTAVRKFNALMRYDEQFQDKWKRVDTAYQLLKKQYQ